MMPASHRFAGQPVIIGSGLAGLLTALYCAPEPVVLISKGALAEQTSSAWAQGGLAAALGADDGEALHIADTLRAGAGLCDPDVVAAIVAGAPRLVDDLQRFGVTFDHAADGGLALGLEAAHSRNRIVHAGDGTGGAIMRALTAAVRRTPSITVVEGAEVRRLLTQEGAVAGVLAATRDDALRLETGRVVIATGGLGGLFDDSTNPRGSFGQGLALAAHAGASFADLEFIQFHPTALDGPARPMPLISEAVRGEGAVLIDETGRRFMNGHDLAPRDVVARAVWSELRQGHRVFLDTPPLGRRFVARFPAIAAACRAAGLDPVRNPIPVRPAAHFHMGGIAVDLKGRSSIPGLWACGEAASTGLHGANRLASNSLMEAGVSARFVAESVNGSARNDRTLSGAIDLPPASDPMPVRSIVSAHLGIVRDEDGLHAAIDALHDHVLRGGPSADAALVGLMVAVAALRRTTNCGAHHRTDAQDGPVDAPPIRSRITLGEALAAAQAYVSSQPLHRYAS